MIVCMENTLLTMAFSAASHNVSSSHLLGYLQFGLHCGGNLVSLPTGVLKVGDLFVLIYIIRPVGNDPVLRLLLSRSFEEVD